MDLHFPSDRSLPALPLSPFGPLRDLPDQYLLLGPPVRRLPRQGRCHRALSYHPSAPEGPGGPLFPPLAREVPTTVGIRFTASSAAILLCSADCALSADSRAFSVAVVASPGCITGCTFCRLFLTIQLLLHFVMTHWLFERPQRPRTRTLPLTALLRAALSAACRADSDASPAEVSAFAALSSA